MIIDNQESEQLEPKYLPAKALAKELSLSHWFTAFISTGKFLNSTSVRSLSLKRSHTKIVKVRDKLSQNVSINFLILTPKEF